MLFWQDGKNLRAKPQNVCKKKIIFVPINGINRFRKKPRKVKVIAKVLAVTFFLLSLHTTRTYMVVIFLVNECECRR